MSIQEHLNKIRNAIYGREVRESIAKGIETAYDDASENGNANMEVKIARGTNPNLNTRLNKMDETDSQNTEKIDSNYNEVTAQLAQTQAQKVDKNGAGQVTWSNISQDAREQISGDKVAVVGNDSVLGYENIVDNSIPLSKLALFRSTNLFNPYDVAKNKTIDTASGTLTNTPSYNVSALHEVTPNVAYTILGPFIVAYYNQFEEYIGRFNLGESEATITFTPPDNARYARFVFRNDTSLPLEEFQLNKGEELLAYEPYRPPIIEGVKVDGGNIEFPFINEKENSNLFNPYNMLESTSIDADTGVPVENSGNDLSVFHKIDPNETYTILGPHYVAYYDYWGDYINRPYIGDRDQVHTFTTPRYAHYARFISPSEDFRETPLKEFQLNKGTELLPYEPYIPPTLEGIKVNRDDIIGDEEQVIPNDFFVPEKSSAYENTEEMTVAEIYQMYDDLIAEFPNNFTKNLLGKDASGEYDIFEIVYKPLAGIKPSVKILLELNMHGGYNKGGDSKATTISFYELIKSMMVDGGKNKALNYLRFNSEIRFIPITNPWGVDNNTRGNANSVDLNRDYGDDITEEQPETTLLKKWVNDNLDANLVLAVHSFGVGASDVNRLQVISKSDEVRSAFREAVNYTAESMQSEPDLNMNPGASMDPTFFTWVRKQGIPSALPEFPTFGSIHEPFSSKMYTHYVELLGNLIYRFSLRF